MSTPIVSRSQDSGDSASQTGCAVCGVTNKLLRCSRCKTAKYCTKDHQIIDWKHHKAFCYSEASESENSIAKLNISASNIPNHPKKQKDHRNSSSLVENRTKTSNLNTGCASEVTRRQSGHRHVQGKNEKYRSA